MKVIRKFFVIGLMAVAVFSFNACSASGFVPKVLEALSKGLETSTSAIESSVEESSSENLHEHDWDEGTENRAATCTEEGEMLFTCECGETKTETIDALGHNWVEGICERCEVPQPTDEE